MFFRTHNDASAPRIVRIIQAIRGLNLQNSRLCSPRLPCLPDFDNLAQTSIMDLPRGLLLASLGHAPTSPRPCTRPVQSSVFSRTNAMKRLAFLLSLFLVLFLAACNPPATPTPTPVPPTATAIPATATPTLEPPQTAAVVISEVLGGIKGNNNREFIELYNPTELLVDLKGWSLWYRLKSGDEEVLVYRWRNSALIPPHGHFLLGRAEQDLGIIPDATFTQALNIFNGGLQLRQKDGTVIDG
ncbi:MAG: lamin tail domain-containing protein, partial [Chloroflexi bacterium]|nr:lamin tail domain-containing protein [Chloroflexota bacterium]